jgi:hypothetical protein
MISTPLTRRNGTKSGFQESYEAFWLMILAAMSDGDYRLTLEEMRGRQNLIVDAISWTTT